MKEFEGIAMTSVDEALQGRISGLDIVANSGNLGAGTTMRLRGVSTINGDANPLIVVNGNVWENDANKDFDYTDANAERFAELLNVNPEDIETISVLKDAAATAIWGAQGANGVIEIKTKRGERGKTRVQYTYRFTGTWQPESYKLLNGTDYTMFLKEAFFNQTLDNSFSTPGTNNYIPEINYNPNFTEHNMYDDDTDWLDAVKQFGQFHQHFLSLTGGGERANFRISGGYDNQTGSVIKQHLDRFTTRVALDYFVSNRIKVSTNFDLTYTKNQKNYNVNGDLIAIAYNKMPNLSIYEEDENGNDTDRYYTMNRYIDTPSDYKAAARLLQEQYDMSNPVAVAHNAKNDERTVSLSPEFILRYDMLGTEDDKTKLTYEGQIIFSIYSLDDDVFYPGTLLSNNWKADSYNIASTRSYKSNSLSTRHTLTFTPYFKNEAHKLSMMARVQYNTGNSSDQNYGIKWLPTTNDITSALAGGVPTSFSSGAGEWKSMFMLFQMHYAYKGKYIFDATIRRDGSVNFGPERRWGNFPGISARWNISDEALMQKVKWVNMLSIRPGWGIVGRQPGSEGLFYSRYTNGAGYLSVGTSVAPANIQMKSLKWEQKETYNIGTDFGFFNERLTGSVDVYKRDTKDLLSNIQVPALSNLINYLDSNIASLTNQGVEVELNGILISTKDLSWTIGGNMAYNVNRITKLNTSADNKAGVRTGGISGGTDNWVQMHQVGYPVSSFYVYQQVYDQNGKPLYGQYVDRNDDGVVNESDRYFFHKPAPDFTFGFNTNLSYKNWTFALSGHASLGNYVYNNVASNSEMFKDLWVNSFVSNRLVSALDSNFPDAMYISDYYIENGSYLKLDNATVGYTFPKLMEVNPNRFASLNIFATVQNICTFTKYSGIDPEVWGGIDGTVYPRPRTYVLGLKFNF
jgi:TonB-linked SusC/RagA family outer membrane protein